MKQGGFYKKSMRDVPLDGKTVLVRVDYNVPLENGKVKDDYRVRSSLPTIHSLLDRGCKLVLIAHLGRPDGQKVPGLSLEPVARLLGELLGKSVTFVPDCVGDAVVTAVKSASPNSVILLENVRFYAGDESNDPEFAQQIAKSSQANYFVQDGFGVAHRAQASTDAITQFLPSVAGLLLEKEFMTISQAMETPRRPLVAVLGGSKISDKIQLVERFVTLADKVVIGGAMANNFLKHQGVNVGKSLVENDVDVIIDKVYETARKKVGDNLVDNFVVIPKDVAVGKTTEPNESRIEKTITSLDDDDIILDIGAETMNLIDDTVKEAGCVIWNGTLGFAELPQFSHGSARLALTLAANPEITSIIGGGDTADFVLHWDASKGRSFSLVSTGGGASLELMSGKKLPGIEALIDA